MKNKLTLPILFFVILAGLAIYVILNSQNNNQTISGLTSGDSEIIFYSSDSCPFCVMVEDYLRENNIAEKVSFTKKQLDNNQANYNDFLTKVNACGFSANEAGVPFLWTGSSCLIGGSDIIDFFEDKARATEINIAETEELTNEQEINENLETEIE